MLFIKFTDFSGFFGSSNASDFSSRWLGTFDLFETSFSLLSVGVDFSSERFVLFAWTKDDLLTGPVAADCRDLLIDFCMLRDLSADDDLLMDEENRNGDPLVRSEPIVNLLLAPDR